MHGIPFIEPESRPDRNGLYRGAGGPRPGLNEAGYKTDRIIFRRFDLADPFFNPMISDMVHKNSHLSRLESIFSRDPIYFITTNAENRQTRLDSSGFHEICKEVWETGQSLHGWSVGPYVIMPDHVHFFCRGSREIPGSLSLFVGKWKEWTAKRSIRRLGFSRPVWQPEFFDHVVRNKESFSKKIDYVLNNPVRAGFCEDPLDWPYRGNPGDWIGGYL